MRFGCKDGWCRRCEHAVTRGDGEVATARVCTGVVPFDATGEELFFEPAPTEAAADGDETVTRARV